MNARLEIRGVTAVSYFMPLKRPYGTARGVSRGSLNFIVRIVGRFHRTDVEGQGECQPRHLLTGDGPKDGASAWAFLCAAAAHLEGRTLDLTGPGTAVTEIRRAMADLGMVARNHADARHGDKPFRGTLLGIEVALLDLVARALGLQISDLLGRQRDAIEISISTLSTTVSPAELGRRVVRQRRFPITRVKGTGSVQSNLATLRTIVAANRSVGRDKPVWMDINEACTVESARDLIGAVVDEMRAGTLTQRVILEGLLPKAEFLALPRLQAFADQSCREEGSEPALDLRIMPDEGLWDIDDLRALNAAGGCRAINLKAPKAGGLLASLDVAEAAVRADPEIHISIGGMVGTSDLTAFALHNLGRAMPRLDYITATPPQNTVARITLPVATYVAHKSNRIASQVEPGLGTRVVEVQLAPFVRERWSVGRNARDFKTLVFGGDTSLGDVHHLQRGEATLARLRDDPMAFFRGLEPLLANKDLLILNFESVLATEPSSPLEGKKRYLGWDSPERTLACLRELGVDAVGLANNHAMDFGADVLLETIERFRAAGIRTFGAGRSSMEAAAPLTLDLTFGEEQRAIHIFGVKSHERRLREFDFFATDSEPGVALLRQQRLEAQIRDRKRTDPGSLIIVFPHWNTDYRWPTPRLRERGRALIDAGADFVIGHGSHMVSDFVLAQSHGIVWSLGNFQFNWAGRHDSMPGAVPFGFVARLSVSLNAGAWATDLRLYPIRCDNRALDYRPRPVNAAEMDVVREAVAAAVADGDDGGTAHRVESDAYGWCFTLPGPERVQSAPSTLEQERQRTNRAALTSLRARVYRGSATSLLAEAAADAGLFLRDDDTYVHVSRATNGPTLFGIRNASIYLATSTDGGLVHLDGEAGAICKDKAATKRLLENAGIAVAEGRVFAPSERDDARHYVSAIHPAVLKPLRGRKGRGVSVGVSPEGFDTAWDAACDAGRDHVLIEREFAHGIEARYLVVDGNVEGVCRRLPPSVVGDGIRTISELIELKNASRQENLNLRRFPIRLDAFRRHLLHAAGLSADAVPEVGRVVTLGEKSNNSSGGEPHDITDMVHPEMLDVARRAARAIPGLRVGGVDVLARDHREAPSHGSYIVVEINTHPGMAMHHFPAQGTPRRPARRIIDAVMQGLAERAD